MINAILESITVVFEGLGASTWESVALQFLPFALLLELPLMLLVILGMAGYAFAQKTRPAGPRRVFPSVTCVITCYSEKEDVQYTLNSLANQIYPGQIEIIAVIDGAIQNNDTLLAAQRFLKTINAMPQRKLIVLPKWQRGGRVSSLNAGLSIATGEIVMALDADTSFDNDMVYNATAHFNDPNVIAVSGNLRVRNAAKSLATRLQALEYLIAISGGKTGLSTFNIINNISGALGIFRADILRRVSGWDAGTAEDLDMTQRLKQLFGRNKNYRIVFDPKVVGHTDVPDTFKGFFWQRFRWDGDLFYIFIRKYGANLRPGLIGWKNFISTVIGGIFFQIVMPFIILFYTIYLINAHSIWFAFETLLFVYIIYLSFLIAYFFLYLILISERVKNDFFYFLYLPVYPVFAFATRLNCTIALLNEMINQGHLDTAMAPWWVLKKTKY